MKRGFSSRLLLVVLAGIVCGSALYFVMPHPGHVKVLKKEKVPAAPRLQKNKLHKKTKVQKEVKLDVAVPRADTLLHSAALLNKAGRDKEAFRVYEKIVNSFPNTEFSGRALFREAEIHERREEKAKAVPTYQTALTLLKAPEEIKAVRHKLGKLNMERLLSAEITPNSKRYEVKAGDSLFGIAAKFNSTAELIKKINRLKGDLIMPEMKLKIPTAVFSICVNKTENILILRANGRFFKLYPVATGKDYLTPAGMFKAVTKLVDPVWYKTGAIIPSGSPENILGTRWIGLSKKGYGIHGTTIPESIGSHCTKGCVRMRNKDVEEIFSFIIVGADVEIVE